MVRGKRKYSILRGAAIELNFYTSSKTSAKDGMGVSEAFLSLAKVVLERDQAKK